MLPSDVPRGEILKLEILGPLDQPFDTKRAINWLTVALGNPAFVTWRLAVGFVKQSGLIRIAPNLEHFRKRGGRAEAVFGVDLMVTSKQALELASAQFDRVEVWHHPNSAVTFHPKIFMFDGPSSAMAIVGSNNLTAGGIETNAEAAVKIEFDLPNDRKEWLDFSGWWSDLLAHPNCLNLSSTLLTKLIAEGVLLDETRSTAGMARGVGKRSNLFPSTKSKPASPLRATASVPGKKPSIARAKKLIPIIPEAHLIQIRSHHNGEIFLSKGAVNQYPEFFGFPFTGSAKPKKASNQPYPQRVPDPITHWRAFKKGKGAPEELPNFPLNMVYYQKKGEIRITIPPSFAKTIPEYSILEMRRAEPGLSLDYECDVYAPGHPEYSALLAVCTHVMPSGGAGKARKYGWV